MFARQKSFWKLTFLLSASNSKKKERNESPLVKLTLNFFSDEPNF